MSSCQAAVKTLILWVPHDDWDAIQDFVGRKIHGDLV